MQPPFLADQAPRAEQFAIRTPLSVHTSTRRKYVIFLILCDDGDMLNVNAGVMQ
jgi:hypothetical protein